MRWEIDFVENENYFRVTLEGVFSVEEHANMMEDIFSHPLWKPGTPLLFDDRKLSHKETTQNDLQRASIEVREGDDQLGGSKIAFLTNSRADFDTLRRFELMTEEDVSAWMHVFFTENEALRWLQAYRVRQT